MKMHSSVDIYHMFDYVKIYCITLLFKKCVKFMLLSASLQIFSTACIVLNMFATLQL